MQQNNDVDVLIAGAGPVGLVLANFLAIHGRSVLVVESRSDLIDYPRGVGLDDESFRSIQTLGLVDEVRPFTVPHHVMRLVNGRGQTMVTNDPAGEPFGWPRKHGFIQPRVDRAFYDGLSRFETAQVRFDRRLVGIDQDESGVTATVLDTADGEGRQETVRASYLVGCEGGASFTRKWMGVDFEGRSPSTRWVVIDVRNDPLGTPNVYLGADPARPYVSIGLPHGIRRWEFMLFDDEPSELVEDDTFVARLLEQHVTEPLALDVIRRRVFTHHGRIASSFRSGRVLIAGDAAHLMPVWMGQGWNSGMRDATNLGWKLAAVLRGDCDDGLLDTFDSERRDHAKAMIDLSMTFGRVIKPTDRRVALARDTAATLMNLAPSVKEYFADMRFKPMPRYGRGVVVDQDTFAAGTAGATRRSRLIPVRNTVRRTSPVGLQFIQPRVTTADGRVERLDDVIGNWWTVIGWGNDPSRHFTETDLESMQRLGFNLVTLVSQTQREWPAEAFPESRSVPVADHTGELKKWFDVHSVGLVFLRPDRFVAAAGFAQDGPRMLNAVLLAMRHTGAHDRAEPIPEPDEALLDSGAIRSSR